MCNIRKQKTHNQNSKNNPPQNEDSTRSLWDISVPTFASVECLKEGREEGIENLFKKMTENFPNLVKDIDIQVQEVQRVPKR